MSREDQRDNQYANLAQDVEANSEVHRGPSSVDNVESGFRILARMIADFHLRRKDSRKHSSSSDEGPYNTPHKPVP